LSVWYVYIVECSDKNNSLYTGITNDLEKRIAKHNAGRGAKFLRGSRLPVCLKKYFEVETKSYALRVEWKIKSLPREEKLKFSLSDYDYKHE
jgi:putative endonuclease